MLSGPVDVCVAVPRLELDRPFTYVLPEDSGAGLGSMVSVKFHGRTVKGWIVGPTEDQPRGRLLPVTRVRSPVRFFDESQLRLLRWVAERYLTPLCVVIERSFPPRVAGEEKHLQGNGARRTAPRQERPGDSRETRFFRFAGDRRGAGPRTDRSWDGDAMGQLLAPGATSWYRPLPDDETGAAVRTVSAALERGRTAIVLVPETEPVPFTAAAVLEAFDDRAVWFAGGDDHERYRNWLRMLAGEVDVVVGTRPAVFAPLKDLGLIWISREVHPAHREERAPYYHVREIASARARLEGAACVVSSLSPSVETAVAAKRGEIGTVRPPRNAERAAAPLVETAAPGAEDRSPRLTTLLRAARTAAVVVSRAGYGVARVCRSCGQPARCAECGGPIGAEGGAVSCLRCGAAGRCSVCSGTSFGIERGGVERIAEWAARIAPTASVEVGTAASVKDVGPRRLDLVALLDPDRALARPGFHAGEQALATWMEAAAWAGPRSGGGRVLAHTRTPGDPAVQALVRWEPLPFLFAEATRRAEAGFAPGHAVFRVSSPAAPEDVERAMKEAGARPVLTTAAGQATLCLVTVPPGSLHSFRGEIVRMVTEGNVDRIEAEPNL
jgi:primosomal protein N' (replication factor Y) (superfamily II helicase)